MENILNKNNPFLQTTTQSLEAHSVMEKIVPPMSTILVETNSEHVVRSELKCPPLKYKSCKSFKEMKARLRSLIAEEDFIGTSLGKQKKINRKIFFDTIRVVKTHPQVGWLESLVGRPELEIKHSLDELTKQFLAQTVRDTVQGVSNIEVNVTTSFDNILSLVKDFIIQLVSKCQETLSNISLELLSLLALITLIYIKNQTTSKLIDFALLALGTFVAFKISNLELPSLISDFLSTKNRPQALDTANVTKLFTVISQGVSLAVFGLHADFKGSHTMNDLAKRFAEFNKSVVATTNFFSILTNWLNDLISVIASILGFESFSLIKSTEPLLKEGLDMHKRAEACIKHSVYDQLLLAELKTIVETFRHQITTFRNDPLYNQYRTNLVFLYNMLDKDLTALTKMTSINKHRLEPYVVCVSGAPGVGKSFLMQLIEKAFVLESLGKDAFVNGELKDLNQYIYDWNASSKFHDRYPISTQVVKINDLGQKNETKNTDPSVYEQLIQAIGNNVCPLDCAVAELKSTKFFEAKVILLNTNIGCFNAITCPTLAAPAAFTRRLNNSYQLVPVERFRKPGIHTGSMPTGSSDPKFMSMLDHAKIIEYKDNNPEFDFTSVYEFYRKDPATGALRSSDSLSYHEFFKEIVDNFHAHRQTQKELAINLNAESKKTLEALRELYAQREQVEAQVGVSEVALCDNLSTEFKYERRSRIPWTSVYCTFMQTIKVAKSTEEFCEILNTQWDQEVLKAIYEKFGQSYMPDFWEICDFIQEHILNELFLMAYIKVEQIISSLCSNVRYLQVAGGVVCFVFLARYFELWKMLQTFLFPIDTAQMINSEIVISDVNIPEHDLNVINKVKRNMFDLYVFITSKKCTTKLKLCCVTFYMYKCAFTVHHVFSTIKAIHDKTKEGYYSMKIGYVPLDKDPLSVSDCMFTFDFDELEFSEIHKNRDLLLIKHPMTQSFRDITPLMMTRNHPILHLAQKNKTVMCLVGSGDKRSVTAEHFGHALEYTSAGEFVSINHDIHLNIPINYYKIEESCKIGLRSEVGDCGKLGFIDDPIRRNDVDKHNLNSLMYMHTSGNGHTGSGIYLHKELFTAVDFHKIDKATSFAQLNLGRNHLMDFALLKGKEIDLHVHEFTHPHDEYVVATSDEKPRSKTASQMEKTKMYDSLPPLRKFVGMKPPILHPHMRSGELVDPKIVGLKNFGKNTVKIKEIKSTDVLIKAVSVHVFGSLSTEGSVLSFRQAVGGINEDSPIPKISVSSGCGEFWKHFKFSKNSDIFGDEGLIDFSKKEVKDVMDCVNYIINLDCNVPFVATQELKDETRVLTIENGKEEIKVARSFFTQDVACQILFKMYFADLYTSVLNNRINNSIALGINMHDCAEVGSLIGAITKFGDRVYCKDFKAFDSSVSIDLMDVFSRLVMHFYRNCDPIANFHRFNLLQNLSTPFVKSVRNDGTFFSRFDGGLISGSWLTSIVGSVINVYTHFGTLMYIQNPEWPDLPAERCLDTFQKLLQCQKTICYGDDSMFNFDRTLIPMFTEEKYVTILKDKYGLTATNEIDEEFVDDLGCAAIYDSVFLARNFRIVTLDGEELRVAPLRLRSILNGLYYEKKDKLSSDREQSFEMRLLELSLHPKDVFDYHSKYMISNMKEHYGYDAINCDWELALFKATHTPLPNPYDRC